MEWQAYLSAGLTLGALIVMTTTRLAPHLIMLGALIILSVTGVLTSAEALAGFSNAGVITVAAMFIVASGIYSSGAADMLNGRILGHPRTTRTALGRIFAPVVGLSAFLNNTPVVATLIPVIHVWSRKIGIATSKLMIPLSYCSILGGTITLIGTSTNLVVDGQYQALTGQSGFSMFAITPVGLIVVAAGLLAIWLFFPAALPDRSEAKGLHELREFILEVSVDPKGPLVGMTVQQAGLRSLSRIYLVEIERDGNIVTAVPSEEKLRAGDRLVFTGDTEAITDLLRIKGIISSPETGQYATLVQEHHERCLVEAIVSPQCAALGQSIRDARFRDQYGAVVLAVARNGERVQGNLGNIRLSAGDILLLEARPAFVTRQRYNRDFLLISDLGTQSPRHERAWLAWGILVTLVALASFNVLSMLNAALLGAALMLITGCCTLSQAGKDLNYNVLATIAASFALGTALQKTGVSAMFAETIIDLSGGSPLLMLILTYVVVSLLTEIVTNNAAAILTLPIVLDITSKADLHAEPFVIAIMFAASASFDTPLGYQTNLMVYGPGNYRFRDFLKVGIPMNIWIGIMSVTSIYWLWPLSVGG